MQRHQSSDSIIHKPPPKLSQFLLKSFEDANRIYVALKGVCKGMGHVVVAKKSKGHLRFKWESSCFSAK